MMRVRLLGVKNVITDDKASGMYHEVKGKAKAAAGKITDNPKLETKGKVEEIAGKMQEPSL